MSTAVHTTAVAARAVRRLVTALAMCAAVPGLAGRTHHGMDDIARQLVVVPSQAPVADPVDGNRPRRDARCGQRNPGEYEQYVAARSGRKRRHCPADASPEGAAIARPSRAQRTLRSVRFPRYKVRRLVGRARRCGDGSRIAAGEPPRRTSWRCAQHDGAAVAAYPTCRANAGAMVSGARSVRPPAAQALLPGWGSVAPSCCAAGPSSVRMRRRHWTAVVMHVTTTR